MTIKKTLISKICQARNSEFIGNTRQKYCSDYCAKKLSRRQTNEEANKKWLSKKPEEKKRQDNDQVSYSFFRKKYGIKKMFQACRG